MLHQTQGIVLKTFKFSETSVIAKIYTEKFGLQSYIINGVYAKNNKNKPALLQPLTILDIVAYYREHKNIQHIKEIKPAYLFVSLLTDVVKSALTLFFSEVLYRTIKEESPNPDQFKFLDDFIVCFDQISFPTAFANLHLWFLIHFAQFLGFSPRQNFFYTQRPYFNLVEGEFTHHPPTHSYFLKLPLSHVLFKLMNLRANQTEQIRLSKSERTQLLHALLTYYKLHIEGFGDLKSISVLETIFAD
ncbi:MAG: DNA repair protein RecO [Sphingobacteriales bacterium]|nr:MAG: DNA repair protein RecO [Sphingobacteriales bacterium]